MLRRLPLTYQSARYQDDGSPEYLQWWYFDADFESGDHLMVIMVPRAFGQLDGHTNGPDPTITFCLTDSAGHNHSTSVFYPDTFSGDPDAMEVTFGENSMGYRDGSYFLHLQQDGIGCELEYEPDLLPWAPLPGQGGHLAAPLLWASLGHRARGKYFHYGSIIPRARVTGRLMLPDREVVVEGEGYHEQGHTNVPFERMFSYWYWTRFYVGEWTFIFPVAAAPRHALNAKMRALAIYRGKEQVCDLFDLSGLCLSHRVLSTRRDPISGRDIPAQVSFRARWRGLKLRMMMTLNHERERFQFDMFNTETPLQPVWYQHLTHVEVDMCWRGERIQCSGQGIFETMLSGAV